MVGPPFIFRANIPADLSDGNKESSDLNGQWERNWQSQKIIVVYQHRTTDSTVIWSNNLHQSEYLPYATGFLIPVKQNINTICYY